VWGSAPQRREQREQREQAEPVSLPFQKVSALTEQTKKTKTMSDWALLRRLWPFLRPDRGWIYLALLLTPLTMLAVLIQPLLLKRGLDEHLVTGRLEGVGWLVSVYFAAVWLHYFLEATYTLSLANAGQRTISRLRERVYRHFLEMSPSFYDKRPAGALLTRATSDIEAVGETLTSGVVSILLDMLMASGILFILFWMNWQLTLLLLAALPPLLWAITVLRKRLRDDFVLIRESLSAFNSYLTERLQGMDILQLFGHQEKAYQRYASLNQAFRDATVRSNVFDALMYALVDGFGSICVALLLWYAISPFWQGWIGVVSVGLLAALIDYVQKLFRPLQEFSGKIAIIQRATTALEKIFLLLDDGSRIRDGEKRLPDFQGHLVFDNVSFAYDKEDILKNVCFEIKPGEAVALVGATGCGKTTITRLITRMYDGYRGSIRLDGVELRDISLQDIRQQIATVRQDIHLFSESARFNVCLDHPTITEQQMLSAAQLVHADQVVAQWSDGWEHSIKERGTNLSVGESQLLTFARIMAYDPALVILDEATASIDPQTEALVQDATRHILEQKTVLVVAHRLSTITSADRILVLAEGRLCESGTHEELRRKGGLYASLYEKSFADKELLSG